jgi:hypothetical protein
MVRCESKFFMIFIGFSDSASFRFCGYVTDEEEAAREVVPPDDLQETGEGDEAEDLAHRHPRSKAGMAVFFSNMGLCTMRTAHEINVDGTFATCPPPFKQLVFIQAKQLGKRAVPVVFALLSNKVVVCKMFNNVEFGQLGTIPLFLVNVPFSL